MAAYVHIDPDKHITSMCNNDNRFRMLANFNTMEDFATALNQRRHILFDGTGKDVSNTCGRIISRLRSANYRVFVCIVAASKECCLTRISARQSKTGRGVPPEFVRSTIESLQTSMPLYISQQASLAEAVLVYDNDGDSPVGDPSYVIREGSNNAKEASAFVGRKLQLLKLASVREPQDVSNSCLIGIRDYLCTMIGCS